MWPMVTPLASPPNCQVKGALAKFHKYDDKGPEARSHELPGVPSLLLTPLMPDSKGLKGRSLNSKPTEVPDGDIDKMLASVTKSGV